MRVTFGIFLHVGKMGILLENRSFSLDSVPGIRRPFEVFPFFVVGNDMYYVMLRYECLTSRVRGKRTQSRGVRSP